MDNILEIKDLVVRYETEDGVVKAVNAVNLALQQGAAVGLVGETGAGKTTLAKSILRLIQWPPGRIVSGEIIYRGQDLTQITEEEMCKIRGNEISMIFQDPMTALNPVMTVGKQISEVIAAHENVSNDVAEEKMREMLAMVGIDPDRAGEYPHQFSGGMKQRVVIAIALACNPNLLVAGEIVEQGSLRDVFKHGVHPYTEGLFDSIPKLHEDVERLQPIDGLMPDPANLPQGCKFHPRCRYAKDVCGTKAPETVILGEGHTVCCHRFGAEKDAWKGA